jgi:hypothetical protein
MPEEIGDLPTPTAEPPERFPGGVDSIEDEEKYGEIPDEPAIRDLDPVDNPATEGLPDEVQDDLESRSAEDSDDPVGDDLDADSEGAAEDEPVPEDPA